MKRRIGILGLVAGAAALSLLASAPKRAEEAPARRNQPDLSRTTSGHRASAVSAAAAEAPADDGVYRLDEIMVSAVSADALDALVEEHGLQLRRRSHRQHVALVAVPDGKTAQQLLGELRGDPRLASAAPNAVIRGAGAPERSKEKVNVGSDGDPPNLSSLQWHLQDIAMPARTPAAVYRIKIAVLDTGVAHAEGTFNGRVHRVPDSLAGLSFEDPYDFVDDDPMALDEHQHGTHIASLIASNGRVQGVAPGARIMPVRVLDAQNRGTEFSLIEGIHWAVDHGAEVINMSLAFPPGYVPSAALRGALQDAADAGVVMVAAAGNDGRSDVPSWPAASPLVIGVGAYVAPASDMDQAAAYSNLGVGIDLMAPGGDLASDHNGDGLPDGMVAETIDLNDPSTVGAWMFAGTSQAAAVVSGGAAWMLASGATADQVRSALLQGSAFWSPDSFAEGCGAGGLDIEGAQALLGESSVLLHRSFGASLLAWPAVTPFTDGSVRGQALVSLVDEAGQVPREDLEVYGTAWGPSGPSSWKCTVPAGIGRCTIKGEIAKPLVAFGDPVAAWAFSVEAVVQPQVEIPYRPSTILYGSDAFELMLAGIAETPELNDALLAVRWSAGDDDRLGPIGDGFTVLNSGTGLASSPFGVVFTPGAARIATQEVVDVDLDGTGLATSPIGFLPLHRVVIDGTGLATSPIGFQQLNLVAFSGTGLATSPIGFTAMDLFSPLGTAPSLGMGMNGSVLFLADGTLAGASRGALSPSTQALLADGGFVTSEGFEAASLLAGSGSVSVGLSAIGTTVAMSEQGQKVD